jgi:hypothetical protein
MNTPSDPIVDNPNKNLWEAPTLTEMQALLPQYQF